MNGAVDDLKNTATGELLVLDQSDVWFDPGGVAIHHEANSSGRSQNGCLSIAEPVLATGFQNAIPYFSSGILEVLRTGVVDLLDRVAMHLHDPHHRFGIFLVLCECPDHTCHFGAGQIRSSVEQSGQSAAKSVGCWRVIRSTAGHDQ